MSGRLEVLEADARKYLVPGRVTYGAESSLARDVLLLVEIARAAQRLRYAPGAGIDDDVLVAREDFYALRRALARLDATTTETGT